MKNISLYKKVSPLFYPILRIFNFSRIHITIIREAKDMFFATMNLHPLCLKMLTFQKEDPIHGKSSSV